MAKEKITYQQFFETVDLPYQAAVTEIHTLMESHGCKLKIEPAKSGYVVSYLDPKSKKTVLNLVFRKSGMHMRLYADHVPAYTDRVAALPQSALALVDKAPDCKRLLDFTQCSSKCVMGCDFTLAGKRYQKCRYGAFLLPMTDENMPALLALLKAELACRAA